MPWSTSTRRQRLPNDWAKRVAATKKGAGNKCQALSHAPDCNRIGAECDHIHPNDDHSLTNLQWLSKPCHKAKTLAEATEARAQRSRNRKPKSHPGIAT